MNVGLISDTHGLLRDEAMEALEGSDLILHAGDVGGPEILAELSTLAPVHAVRGNTDRGGWAESLPRTEVVTAGAVDIYMIHDIEELDLDPHAAELDVVVYGHSHRPDVTWRDRVLYVNPGAAGHRRFTLPVTVGRLVVSNDGTMQPEILSLEIDP